MQIGAAPSEIPVLLLYNLDLRWSAQERAEVLNATSQVHEALRFTGYPTTLVQVTSSDLDDVLSCYDPFEYVVFNWCESLPGMQHSESLVAEYLEQHGFTFTGAGPAALALASDKRRVKQLLDESGILTPRWETFNEVSAVNWKYFPAIVKPSREHCSEGINRDAVITTEAGLKTKIRYMIRRFQNPALVEEFIEGRELHVSLWGNSDVVMLPPAEMDFSSIANEYERICTYESKFVPESGQYKNIKTLMPAPLSETDILIIEQTCKTAYELTGCRDYARIDLRMKDDLFYITDINPNADLCPDTSTISAAEIAGLTYEDFLSHLILLATERHPELSKKLVSASR